MHNTGKMSNFVVGKDPLLTSPKGRDKLPLKLKIEEQTGIARDGVLSKLLNSQTPIGVPNSYTPALVQTTAQTMNQSMGTSRAGSKLSTLQSFRLSSDRPEPVIISPPTMSSSAMSASLSAVLDSCATR